MNIDDDSDLFAQAMQHVQPIAKSKKIKPHIAAKPAHTKRKKILPIKSSISQHSAQHSPQHVRHTNLQDDGAPWVLRANGVSPDTLKKLAKGQPRISKTLDLHGMTTDEAVHATENCLKSILASGGRVACIIHGRGLHSQDGRAILKQSIYTWLRCGSMSHHILAVIPTPETRGGSCLILLRRDKHR